MKKYILSFIICSLLIFAGCANVNDGMRISVYETNYKGIKSNDYPIKIFTDDTLLNIIDNASGVEPFDVEKKEVLYILDFYDDENNLNSLIIINNGQVSLMKIGLKHNESFLTVDELNKLIVEINK